MPSLEPDIVERDRAYWHDIVLKLTGLGADDAISFPKLSDFAEQVYLRREFSRLRGDPHFATNVTAQIIFAKSRISIARVYAWRADNSADSTERPLMLREADLAFRQAFALDPRLPELSQYGTFLYSHKRTDDLQALAEAIRKFAPEGDTAKYLSALLATTHE